jgi:thiol-disulfide isomerase/thioredoxin
MEVIMKKLKIFLAIVACLLIAPFTVLAEGETSNEDSNKVKLYFFHGDGCPHCADAEEFFDSIEEEYGDKFELVAYEVWYNTDNSELLQKIGDVRDESISGVPYILIGDKSWSGYSSSLDDEIIEAINTEYDKDVADRYDIMNYVDAGDATSAAISTDDSSDSSDSESNTSKKGSNDALAVVLMLVVVAGIGYGVVVARKKTV